MFCLFRTELIRPVETGCCNIRSPHFAFARVRFRCFRFPPRPRFAISYNIHQTHRVFRGGKRAVKQMTIISPAVRFPVLFISHRVSRGGLMPLRILPIISPAVRVQGGRFQPGIPQRFPKGGGAISNSTIIYPAVRVRGGRFQPGLCLVLLQKTALQR